MSVEMSLPMLTIIYVCRENNVVWLNCAHNTAYTSEGIPFKNTTINLFARESAHLTGYCIVHSMHSVATCTEWSAKKETVVFTISVHMEFTRQQSAKQESKRKKRIHTTYRRYKQTAILQRKSNDQTAKYIKLRLFGTGRQIPKRYSGCCCSCSSSSSSSSSSWNQFSKNP